MKDSELYLEAAKKIFYGYENYCCIALQEYPLDLQFTKYMRPDRLPKRHLETGWFGNAWRPPIGREQRVLALCFMAAIAEWEEKHAK